MVSALDKPPPGHHYDPYTRNWAPNLTEAQVRSMWPYNEKEAPAVEPIKEWLDDALQQVAPKPEDAFQHPDHIEVPQAAGGELFAVPPVAPKGIAEEHLALATFMNLATAAERMPSGDNVTLPHHYARFNIEPVRFICENNLNFFQANIVKYILRWDAKNGLEDLRKAKRYLEMFIRFVQKDPDWWQ